MSWDDEDDRDWSTEDFDEDPVDADDVEEPTVPCPGCGREVYEEADACPYCGQWLTSAAVETGRPAWLVWGAVLGIVAMSAGFLFMAWALLAS